MALTGEYSHKDLGWSSHWQALFDALGQGGLVPARVVRVDRGSSLVATPSGVIRAKPTVRLLKAGEDPAALPAVGDWVALNASDELDTPLIDAVLERGNAITRGVSGKTSEVQVLAANIDTVFVVHPIAEPPNLRRVERELSLAWDSGATPIVILTKADLSGDPQAALEAVESIAIGVDALLVNALDSESAKQLLSCISGHRTAVLVGPSGAGKSTLINALLGEERQATHDVRTGDGKGRHTTVAREVITIAGHGVIIDTPGLRALGLTGSEEGILAVFPDIEEYANACRFRDCSHNDEPGCAVRDAVESGALPPERLANYHKLMREAHVAASRSDARLRAEENRKGKVFSKMIKNYKKRHSHK
jgi:ribosome biogenesis GTPase